MIAPSRARSQAALTASENSIGAAEMRHLRSEFPGGEVRELVETFSDEGSLVLEGMTTALERNDGETLRRAAHALRRAAGNFGARPLDALCPEIEASARALDFARAASLLAQVREEFRRVERALEQECQRARNG